MKTVTIKSVFDLDSTDFIDTKQDSTSPFFKVDPKAHNGTDKAIIRFIVNVENPSKSHIKKYVHWLTDAVSNKSFTLDCPSTVGDKSPLNDAYWRLKKSTDILEQREADKFRRKEVHYSLVQVIKYDTDKTKEGKIMIFKYGQKINAMIQAELQPEYGVPHNPWSPDNSKLFLLNGTLLAGFNNYDNSKFVNEFSSVEFDGQMFAKTEASIEKFTTYLKTNAPLLKEHEYQEWSDEDKEKVAMIIQHSLTPPQ